MSTQSLILPHDPLLTTELDHFDFENPPEEPTEIAKKLFDVLNVKNGLGLAANQIGLSHRVFIMRGNPCTLCFNPEITHYSDEQAMMEEGCLTYPDLFVKIRRSENIEAKWTNELGEEQTSVLEGLTARVFQHELDHLNGVNYLQRANPYHVQQAKKLMKKMKRRKKHEHFRPVADVSHLVQDQDVISTEISDELFTLDTGD